jgi:hypothetical protein
MEQVIHDPPAEPFPESSYGVLTERLKSRLLESRIQARELSTGMVTMKSGFMLGSRPVSPLE